MVETLASIVKETKKTKHSLSKKLDEDDIISIWERASGFVEKQMLLRKGVTVPGLGVFTFSQKKIDVGNNKFIIIERPVFVLSEKVIQTHSLHVTKQHTSGQIPIVPLNFTCLSNDSPFNRENVEMSIKDVLLGLSRVLAAKKNVQLDFGRVGRLLVTDRRVKMRFFKDFIASLDSSEGMVNAFRPSTGCSVLSIMSNPATPRTAPTLPRIVEAPGEDSLSLKCSAPPLNQSSEGNPSLNLDGHDLFIDGNDSAPQKEKSPKDSKKLAPLRASSSGKRTLIPKPATLFSTKENPLTEKELWASFPGAQHPTVTKSRPTSTGSKIKHSSSKPDVRPSSCSHSSPSGQELCYLCHQRAMRNFAVDTTEERREKERMENQMLQEYQYQKDLVALAKDFMTKKKNSAYNKEIASINLEATQVKQANKTMKSSEFHPSYVFPQREPTPAKQLKQVEYCGQLDCQVAHVQNQREKIQELEEKLEKEERLKLSEELAKYQKDYNERKVEKMLQYQRALAEQVSLKPTHMLSINPEQQNQPQFSVHNPDYSSGMLRSQKEQSRMLFMEQLSVATAKQNRAKERATMEKLEEAEMLKRTRKELIEDIRAERHRRLDIRKALEKSWDVSVHEKQERELDELAHSQKPSLLVQEQCDRYHRCKQCQRSKKNKGKSNLLSETRYISGARLMV